MSTQQLDVHVANLDCEHDAAAIDRGMRAVPGVSEVKTYPTAARVRLLYDQSVTSPSALADHLQRLGFPPRRSAATPLPRPWHNPKVVTSAISGALLVTGWLTSVAGVLTWLSTAQYLAAVVIGGYFFGREAIEALLLQRKIGIELLMTVAAVVAIALGQPAEAAMLAFLYSISEAAEGYTGEKTRSAIKALMDLSPKRALVRRGGREFDIAAEDLLVDDTFIVKPGQAVATDGVIVRGESAVNQAPVTGESIPVGKHPDDPVFAGSINGDGALEVRATKTAADNTLARIVRMVEEAQDRKGRSQRFIERFGARYSPAVLALGVLIAIAPPVLFQSAWALWVTRATVFIVAAAPCALVISIPITLVAALGTGARHGVLIKGGVYLEELAKVRVIALDKTGTLTTGEPVVTDVLVSEFARRTMTVNDALAIAAGVERVTHHPLARAVLRRAEASGVSPADMTEFRSLTGEGASARFQNRTVLVGSVGYFERRSPGALDQWGSDILRLQSEGKTVVVVGIDEVPTALIAIRDNLRPNARAVISALRALGVRKIVMLTGDNARTAAASASEAGVDETYADLTPSDKAIKVRELAGREGHVAMVGDGVNDAPALAEATVGIAMGAAGTDVALETADVALMADDLEKLVDALRLARRNESVVRQNLALSVFVIGILVIGAVSGVFSLPVAVLGHEISEFVVIASGLRMLRM